MNVFEICAFLLGPIGSNILFATICAAGLAGVQPRICLVLTLWVHLAVIVL